MTIIAPARTRGRLPQAKFNYLPFQGGYDTETPAWEVPPGRLKEAQNYENGISGGYQDIQGYERFDGQDAPSAAQYAIFDVNITGSIVVGDSITQLVSGATAEVIAVAADDDYIVITKISGTFNGTNDIQVSAVTEATAEDTPVIDGAATQILHGQYKNLAADEYRTDIAAVPGSGSVLGVVMLDDVVYAFRNDALATGADLYESTASGWSQVALGFELPFTSGGTYEIQEGDTITGATSTQTAVVTRVMLESGTWAGGDAVGKLIFASQSGAFQAENLDVGANLDVATIAADATAITLSTGGRYEFEISNFGGAFDSRIYGVNGADRGFEFDGTVFAPIDTGMATDTPSHVIVHQNHLFFSYESSAQFSGLNTPYEWTIVTGAGELNTGDTITGFKKEPSSEGNATLGIYNRNKLHLLYGFTSADFELAPYRDEVGAFEWTIQQLAYTMFLDDRGLTSLRTVQEYGNFQHATFTQHLQRFINTKRTNANASCIVRDKNQYRVFFTDNSGLYVTMDGMKITGIMPVLLDHQVTAITSQEDNSGMEMIYFGSDDGFVYQMDKGTSFDGASIDAFMVLHWHFMKSLGYDKHFKNVTLEATGNGYAEFQFTYEIGYADVNIPQPGQTTEILPFSESRRWDDAGETWDVGFWDGTSLAPARLTTVGTGENISLTIRKDSDYFEPILFTGALIRHTMGKMHRA